MGLVDLTLSEESELSKLHLLSLIEARNNSVDMSQKHTPDDVKEVDKDDEPDDWYVTVGNS